MACATVKVLPVPVAPSRVWKRSPRASPWLSSAMAPGWSPAGWWRASISKWAIGRSALRAIAYALETGVLGPELRPQRASRRQHYAVGQRQPSLDAQLGCLQSQSIIEVNDGS